MGRPAVFLEVLSPGHERARTFILIFGRYAVSADPDGNQVGLRA